MADAAAPCARSLLRRNSGRCGTAHFFRLRPVRAVVAAFALLMAGCQPNAAGETGASSSLPRGEGYDFFVLALSWSPSYCRAEGMQANRHQCASGLDHGFVVHGLWPQFENGWPEYCRHPQPNRVPEALARQMLDLMPSIGLVGHQWRKHGACAGVSQREYFTLLRAAAERVSVPQHFHRPGDARQVDPDAVEQAFIDANAGLPADAIAVTCQQGLLREVRICMDKELEFRACAQVDARGCRLPRALMPPPG